MIAQVMLRKRNTVRSMMKRKITKKRIMMRRRKKKKTHQIQTKKQSYFIVATKYCPDFTKHIL